MLSNEGEAKVWLAHFVSISDLISIFMVQSRDHEDNKTGRFCAMLCGTNRQANAAGHANIGIVRITIQSWDSGNCII